MIRARLSGALFLLLAVLGPAEALLAQEDGATVTARLEPSRVRFGRTVDLVIEVEPSGITARIEDPRLPPLAAAVVGQSRESQVRLDTGGMSRTIVYRYRLRPLSAGPLRVDPIQVVVDGRVLQTSPLELSVMPDGSEDGEPSPLAREGAWRAGGPPPFFVTARVDRARARVGEQVTLTFAFYHDPRAPLAESPDYDPPPTPGFWRTEIDREPRVDVERIGRQAYHVQRFRYALFPLRPGSLTIGPATVRVVEPDEARWWRAGETRTLQTDPLRVTIEPLPPAAPGGFAGAVGTYTLDGGIVSPKATATVGVPLELELTVAGQGNPTAVGAPVLPAWPDVDVRPPSVETDTEVHRARVGGRTTFRYLLSPRAPGRLDLGKARFAFFDPGVDGYVVDTIALGEIDIRPAAGPPSASAASRPAGPTLWAAREPMAPSPAGLAGKPWFWAALAGPWAAWLAAAGVGRLRTRRAGRHAARAPIARLGLARRALAAGDPGGAAAGLAAVDAALAARFGEDVPAAAAAAARDARAALVAVAYAPPGRPVPEAVGALERLEAALEPPVHGRGRRRCPTPGAALAAILLVAPAAVGVAPDAAGVDRPSAVERWRAANQAYRAGDFGRAEEAYRGLLAGNADPRLEADLAAALWRSGDRGEAVLHYRHALGLDPRAARIREDLARLRAELGRPPEAASALQAGFDRLRLDEVLAALLALNLLAFLLALAARRSPRAGALARGAVSLVVIFAALAALHASAGSARRLGVALRPAPLSAEPGRYALSAGGRRGAPPALGQLAEGSVVEVLDRTDAGWRVRAPGIPAGWVAPDRIAPVDSRLDPTELQH